MPFLSTQNIHFLQNISPALFLVPALGFQDLRAVWIFQTMDEGFLLLKCHCPPTAQPGIYFVTQYSAILGLVLLHIESYSIQKVFQMHLTTSLAPETSTSSFSREDFVFLKYTSPCYVMWASSFWAWYDKDLHLIWKLTQRNSSRCTMQIPQPLLVSLLMLSSVKEWIFSFKKWEFYLYLITYFLILN